MSIGNVIYLIILVIYLLMLIGFIVDEIRYYKKRKKYKVILDELSKLIRVEEEE